MIRALVLLTLAGCATAPPEPRAEAYLKAVESGDLDSAYSLTAPGFQREVTRDQYRARLQDPEARKARAAAVREGLAQAARVAPELFGAPPDEGAVEVVVRFAAEVRAGHFDQARLWLSAQLRERYTPALLERDYRAEPEAQARLERAMVAVAGVPVEERGVVRFPLAAGGAVVVLREQDGWRLDALE